MHKAHIAINPDTGETRIQTCAEHSRSTAALAGKALQCVNMEAAGYVAGLLHDCGKFTNEFNDYLTKATEGERVKKGSVIHTFAGVRYLLERFHSMENGELASIIASEILAVGVGSHHGLIDLWDEEHTSGFAHRMKRQPEYDKRAIESFHRECASEQEVEAFYQKAEREIAAVIEQIIDYAKSEEEAHFALGQLARLITSAVVEADRTDTRCFMQNMSYAQEDEPLWTACAERLENYLDGFSQTTPIQKARRIFSEHCAEAAKREPGLFRLDLPTGGGKTLAALRFAVLHAQHYKMNRIFYVAPLLSIIEQNAEAIRTAVDDTISVVEHHSNTLREEEMEENAGTEEFLQETWRAPMIVTTLVQLLNTLFDGKMSSVRRYHCLCRSVIILDEVQSVPPKMLSMFNCAINFLVHCCGATVVLCSATQPAFEMAVRQMCPYRRIIEAETLKRYEPIFRRTEIVDAGTCTMQEIADIAVQEMQVCRSLLIVCNTKREAAELYEMISHEDMEAFYLSAGMCMAHRKKELAELMHALEKREKLICISTQVIEAGMDVSFESVIRLSAGLDNIVQAAGRCNRHGEYDVLQKVRICRLSGERLGKLSEIEAAQNALNALLAEYNVSPQRYQNNLSSEEAVKAYYSFLYRDMKRGSQDYPKRGQKLFELLSTNLQFAAEEDEPAYYMGQAFKTAGKWFDVFDNASESVIVPYEEGEALIRQMDREGIRYDIACLDVLLKRVKPYTVSLPTEQIERMMKKGMVYTLLDGKLYILNQAYYDERIGIKEENDLCDTLIL